MAIKGDNDSALLPGHHGVVNAEGASGSRPRPIHTREQPPVPDDPTPARDTDPKSAEAGDGWRKGVGPKFPAGI
jgi:hypothetical protein